MASYAKTDSWAVWETGAAGELTGAQTFPTGTELNAIHGRAMIVALNPGGKLGDPPPEDALALGNFHAARGHNDIFLAHAFHGTPYWGSYMTDLHPDIRESNSELVRPEAELIELAVRSLIEKANMLGAVEKIVCVGGVSYREISKRAELIEKETGIRRAALAKITHYSGGGAGAVKKHKNDAVVYRQIVHKELGL